MSLVSLKIKCIICRTNIFNCSSEFVWVWAVNFTSTQLCECEKEKVKEESGRVGKQERKGILFIQWGCELFNLRWHHLQGLPRSAKHVRRQCIWWISSLLTTRSITNPVSDATTARVPSRFDATFSLASQLTKIKLKSMLETWVFSLRMHCVSSPHVLLENLHLIVSLAIAIFYFFLFTSFLNLHVIASVNGECIITKLDLDCLVENLFYFLAVTTQGFVHNFNLIVRESE